MSVLFGEPFATRLKEQLNLLKDVADLYDDGRHNHALSIAARASVIIEMLRSSEGGSHIKAHGITFSTPIDPNESAGRLISPLASKQVFVDDNMAIVSEVNSPAFADPNAGSMFPVNLGKWLSQPAFYYEPGKFISRDRLVAMMRNRDGAGHPYSLVPPEYLHFAQNTGALSIRVTGANGNSRNPVPALHFASMRQIAHELLGALSNSV